LTLRIVRKGTLFTGEWIEGNRVLEIAGTINGRQLRCRPTRVKHGKWPNDVVKNLVFVADVKKDQMVGRLSGYGARRATSGSFELTKQSR
jgi:hypothetical protein